MAPFTMPMLRPPTRPKTWPRSRVAARAARRNRSAFAVTAGSSMFPQILSHCRPSCRMELLAAWSPPRPGSVPLMGAMASKGTDWRWAARTDRLGKAKTGTFRMTASGRPAAMAADWARASSGCQTISSASVTSTSPVASSAALIRFACSAM